MKKKMKEMMKGMQWVERKDGILWKALPLTALLWALSSQELPAQGLSSIDEDGVTVTEVKAPEVEDKKETTIDWETAIQWTSVKDDDKWISALDKGEKKPWITGWWDGDDDEEKPKTPEWDDLWEKDGSWIAIHGMIQVWKIVIPDYADVASENAAALVCVDASHEKTWLWVSVVRIEDFSKDPANPVSQVTVINPHWDKSFGKASVSVNSEFAFIDKMPEWNGVTAKVLWSYDMWKWWTLEGTYFHGFNKGPDSDAFRLWIAKKINEAWGLTVQWWYKSDYDKMFFGRIIMDVNLWNGFGMQLSCISKNWMLTPTMWVIYSF